MGEVVDLHLGFIAVFCDLVGDCHDSGVKDEAVQRFFMGEEVVGRSDDRVEVVVVDENYVEVRAGVGLLGLADGFLGFLL